MPEAVTFDIFVGGPMGNRRDDGAGLTFSDHLPNIIQATRILHQEVVDSGLAAPGIVLLDPTVEGIGRITHRVFSMIDRAEIGIFDVSSASPSTMYELTLMHALGKDVIPIAFETPKVPEARTLPYYLRDDYSILLNSFHIAEIAKNLRPKLRQAMGIDQIPAQTRLNPITDFYGMPLLDVSATTGLATGYFVNFIQYLIKESNTVFHNCHDLDKLVILVPEHLDDVGGMRKAFADELRKLGMSIEPIDSKSGRLVPAEEQVRGQIILDRVANYIVDIPAPLKSQKSSPRYTKLLKDFQEAKGDMIREAELRLARLERAMIDRFFQVLLTLSRGNEFSRDRMKFMSMEELLSDFRNRSSQG